MKKIIYPAIISIDDGQYVVEFPDLPGCHTWGAVEQDEILEYAVEALSVHLETLIEEEEKLPKPTKLQDLQLKPGEFATLVEAKLGESTPSVKKTLTIPSWLNREATRRGINFSKVLKEALVEAIND
jgi:predicted RNase H-like HicB family nuclease